LQEHEDVTVLMFTVDARPHAIDVTSVVMVVPVPALTRIALAEPWFAGLLRFRGELVPVIDLTQLQAGRASRRAFGTRLAIVTAAGVNGASHALGLIAEEMTDVQDLVEIPPATAPREPRGPAWLCGLGTDGRGTIVQLVSVERVAETVPGPGVSSGSHARAITDDCQLKTTQHE
jgi:chemotaxis signal transduction protein